jgi:predicted RNase H-like HicB family nuclease
MNRYQIIIYWSEEDRAFVAEVPELPGCMAHGTSYEQALTHIQEAMQLWNAKLHPTDHTASSEP